MPNMLIYRNASFFYLNSDEFKAGQDRKYQINLLLRAKYCLTHYFASLPQAFPQ